MGRLCFVCPASGREVDTGIELDLESFDTLYGEPLGCPECLRVHRLGEIKAWVRDKPLDPIIDASHPLEIQPSTD
jgi:hypothetical protein